MHPEPLSVGDRVCFEGNCAAKYGHVGKLRDHAVWVEWEDDSPATWLPRQRVFAAPDEATLRERCRELKPWRE